MLASHPSRRAKSAPQDEAFFADAFFLGVFFFAFFAATFFGATLLAGIFFAASFSEEEVRQLVDELAPEAERGRNLTRHLNTTVDGVFITTEYTYEML